MRCRKQAGKPSKKTTGLSSRRLLSKVIPGSRSLLPFQPRMQVSIGATTLFPDTGVRTLRNSSSRTHNENKPGCVPTTIRSPFPLPPLPAPDQTSPGSLVSLTCAASFTPDSSHVSPSRKATFDDVFRVQSGAGSRVPRPAPSRRCAGSSSRQFRRGLCTTRSVTLQIAGR